MENLKKQIERKRKEMISKSEKHGISSSQVIQTSQELDELINKYQKGMITNE